MSQKRPDPPKQRRYDILAMLSYITTYQQANNHRSPSQRRIQRDLDLSAPSVAHYMLQRLVRFGFLTIIKYGHGYPTDLVVTAEGQIAVQRWREQHPSFDSTDPTEEHNSMEL